MHDAQRMAPKIAKPHSAVEALESFMQSSTIIGVNRILSSPYRTQRLKAGLTKIGTAAPADIIVNDGFMSTDHCHVQCSPAGFVLVDNGATNGSYVNDRKVQKHELVDNDVITLGKTNFKFKSIN